MSNHFYQTAVPIALMVFANLALFQVDAVAQNDMATGIGTGIAIGLGSDQAERVYEEPTDPAFIEYREQLRVSLQKWQEKQLACHGNYSFSRHQSSPMTSNRSVMTSTIRNNKIIRREFKTYTDQDLNGFAVASQKTGWQVQWLEEGETIGSHSGQDPKTLDELYVEADKLLRLRRKPGERLSIKFDDRGLLEYCFIVENAAGCGGITMGFPSLHLIVE